MTKKQLQCALLFSHATLIFLLIGLTHYDKLSFSILHLSALSFLALLGAFYRPRWAFWFFIGLLPLEIIFLGEDVLPIALRPYQLLGGILGVATVLNLLLDRMEIPLPEKTFADLGVFLIAIGAFVAIPFAPDQGVALKQACVVSSFMLLYALMRIYLGRGKYLRMPFLFFVLSAVLVSAYAIMQNLFFSSGRDAQMVMEARPNGTFPEADWLGMFLVFALVFVWINLSRKHVKFLVPAQYIAAFILTCALILTVARSAWLGALAAFITFFVLAIFLKRYLYVKRVFLLIFSVTLVSYGSIVLFGLTRFDLIDRVASTNTGLQEITVSCDPSHLCEGDSCSLPYYVESIDDLKQYGCKHINLEEMAVEKSAGMTVTTTDRPDPNIGIRKRIYADAWSVITKHPFTGIGWGNIGNFLGMDGAGTALNSSNLFLQIWLGSGLLGIFGILFIVYSTIRNVLFQIKSGDDTVMMYGVFVLSISAAILVPNLFNAGALLGFFWLYLALTQVSWLRKSEREERSCSA